MAPTILYLGLNAIASVRHNQLDAPFRPMRFVAVRSPATYAGTFNQPTRMNAKTSAAHTT